MAEQREQQEGYEVPDAPARTYRWYADFTDPMLRAAVAEFDDLGVSIELGPNPDQVIREGADTLVDLLLDRAKSLRPDSEKSGEAGP